MSNGLIALVDQAQRHPTSDATGTALAGALAHQLRYHVAPAYRSASVTPVVWYGTHTELVPKGAWKVTAFDDPDQAGALGYHDVGPDGVPYAPIFMQPTLDGGVAPSTVFSHEAIEAFCDPWANEWGQMSGSTLVAWEACDPVEADAYLIGNVAVSNFVTRAWYNADDRVGPFDYMHKLRSPFTMTKGGYLILMRAGAVTQKFGAEYPEWRKELKLARMVDTEAQPSRTVWRAVRSLA